MRLALIIVLALSLIAVVLFWLTPNKPSVQQTVAMPWQVTVHDQQHSEVFGIILNRTTLGQARELFGQLEGIALYRNEEQQFSLEAYFGKVTIGPFSARIIVTLDATQQELEQLVEHTVSRVSTEDGSLKWTLNQQTQAEQATRVVRSLIYIPSYRGMDADFIKQRFGEPSRQQQLDENGELWFYPERGVRILLDKEGNELFEYQSPVDFINAYSE